MQKKIIALAVASALAPAAAMADTTVYGQVHMSVDSNSGYTTTVSPPPGSKQNGTEVVSNSSRLGFKGSEDLGGGLKAIFQLEAGVDLDGSGGNGDGNGIVASNSLFSYARDSWVGLSGDFGTVLAGRLPLANQYAYDVNYFVDQVGDAGNFTAANNAGGRVSNAIAYATPNMSGFSALIAYVPNTAQSVATIVNGSNNPVDKDASYTLRGAYADGPVKVGLSYQHVGLGGIPVAAAAGTGIGNALGVTPNTPGDMPSGANLKNTSLSGTYDFGAGNVGLQYVHSSLSFSGNSWSQNVYTLGGSFNVASNAAIKAQYSRAGDVTGQPATSAQMLAVGYDYNFSKRTTGYVAYAQTWNKINAAFSVNSYDHGSGTGAPAVGTSDDPSAFSIGVVHKF